jgi:uncharacterized membrane protein
LFRSFSLKDAVFAVAVTVIAIAVLIAGNRWAQADAVIFGQSNNSEVVSAKVDLILAREAEPFQLADETYENVVVYFEAVVNGGPREGERLTAQQIIDTMWTIPLQEIDQGDDVLLIYTSYGPDSAKMWLMQEYDRSGTLIAVGVLFVVLLLLFGQRKGVGTIISLALTCLSIFMIFIPGIISGINIYLCTLIVCVYTVTVTLLLVNGANFKSLSAGVGTLGGILCSGLMFLFVDSFLKLTGMVDEDMVYLMNVNTESPLDLKAIIFASVLIGVLGAALDVGVSIAASLAEIQQINPAATAKDLIRSGLNVGRDILGTMSNTLILVYIGSSLPLTLLLVVYSNSLLELINRESIVVEILQAIIGSIGLLCTIPLTAFFYAFISTRRRNNDFD